MVGEGNECNFVCWVFEVLLRHLLEKSMGRRIYESMAQEKG